MDYNSELQFTSGAALDTEMDKFKRRYYLAHAIVVTAGLLFLIDLVIQISILSRMPIAVNVGLAILFFAVGELEYLNSVVLPKGYQKQLENRALDKRWMNANSFIAPDVADSLQHSGIAVIKNIKTNDYTFVKASGYLYDEVRDKVKDLDNIKDYQVLFLKQENFRYIDMSSSVPGFLISNTKYQPLGQMELMVRYAYNIH